MLSGFDSNGITVRGSRCTGTFIHSDAKKVVILTAGHCLIQLPPAVVTLGATFDGVVNFFAPGTSTGFDDTQFITGAKVVPHPDMFLPSINGNPVGNDWGLYLFPNTGAITSIVNNISPAVLPPMPIGGVNYLDSLNLSSNNPSVTFHTVGYGFGEQLTAPGVPPKSLPNPLLLFGTRSIAEPVKFLNLRNDPNMPTIAFSMNPARGLEGTCNGDSGGPWFLGDSDHVGVLVALTAWGDLKCRATAQSARTDVPNFLNMINVCAKDPTKTVDEVIQCVQTRAFEQ